MRRGWLLAVGLALAGCEVERTVPVPSPSGAPDAPVLPPAMLTPGEWRFTREVVDVAMLGAPAPLAAEIRRQLADARDRDSRLCLTAADPRVALAEPILAIQPGGTCDRPRLSASGASVIGEMRCRLAGSGERRVTIRAVAGAEEAVINTRSRISGRDLPGDIVADIRITGRRIGACPAASAPPKEEEKR